MQQVLGDKLKLGAFEKVHVSSIYDLEATKDNIASPIYENFQAGPSQGCIRLLLRRSWPDPERRKRKPNVLPGLE